MKNIKKYALVVVMLVSVLLLSGCTVKRSIVYQIDTGDKIKIKLDITDGYALVLEPNIYVAKNNKVISTLTFITTDLYQQYATLLNEDEDVSILKKGNEHGVSYIFFKHGNEQYSYVMRINDSNTGVLLENFNSREQAEECLEHISFSRVKPFLGLK